MALSKLGMNGLFLVALLSISSNQFKVSTLIQIINCLDSPLICGPEEINIDDIDLDSTAFTSELDLHVGDWDSTPILRALANSHFPNLTSIKFKSNGKYQDKLGLVACQKFSVRSTLTKIAFQMTKCSFLVAAKANYELLTSMCQALIGACPNLENLLVCSSFYPDLTNCTKLQVFKYTFFQNWKVIDTSSVNTMLSGLPASARELDMDYVKKYDATYRIRPKVGKYDIM